MHQNLGNHDLFARLGLKQIDVNRVAFRDTILPATALYDCKCHKGIICPDQVVILPREKAAHNPTYGTYAQAKGRGIHRNPIGAGLAFAGD